MKETAEFLYSRLFHTSVKATRAVSSVQKTELERFSRATLIAVKNTGESERSGRNVRVRIDGRTK